MTSGESEPPKAKKKDDLVLLHSQLCIISTNNITITFTAHIFSGSLGISTTNA